MVLSSLSFNLSSGMQRHDYSTSLVGFGGAGSAEDMQGNLCEVLKSVRTLYNVILFCRRWFYSESLLCLFSAVQREAQLDRGERPAEIQKPLPSTCPGAAPQHSCCRNTPWIWEHLFAFAFQAQHLPRIHLWGGRDDVHVGASETSCYFPKHILRI